MKYLRLAVAHDVGLHALPAAVSVGEASRFASQIRVRNATSGSDWVDAKSLLSVLALGVEKDHEIEITAGGVDEAEALAALEMLIRTNFAVRP